MAEHRRIRRPATSASVVQEGMTMALNKKGPKGLHTYRLDPKQDNPEEVRFAKAWDAEVNRELGPPHGTLAYLLGDGKDPVVVTDREEVVAATVVQWFGSPVGQAWLRDLGYERKL